MRTNASCGMEVKLCEPDPAHRTVIQNLFVFYRYDLIPFLSGDGGVNRFGTMSDDDGCRSHERSVDDVAVWWTKPRVLLPMLIEADGEPAGFVMVARPPHADPSVDHRVEDFFVLNRWRRRGVGRAAATRAFRRFPGRWELGWLPANLCAAAFWRSVVEEIGDDVSECSVPQAPGRAG